MVSSSKTNPPIEESKQHHFNYYSHSLIYSMTSQIRSNHQIFLSLFLFLFWLLKFSISKSRCSLISGRVSWSGDFTHLSTWVWGQLKDNQQDDVMCVGIKMVAMTGGSQAWRMKDCDGCTETSQSITGSDAHSWRCCGDSLSWDEHVQYSLSGGDIFVCCVGQTSVALFNYWVRPFGLINAITTSSISSFNM